MTKPEADRAVVLATIASGAMIAQQVAGKATRDALFLATFSVKKLPWMMAVGALVSFAAAVVAAWALAKWGPRRVVRVAFLLGTVAFAAEFAASFISRTSLAIVVYLHIALFGAPLISLFWSLVNERFDPHSAKRAIARIATGGTVGGVVGGLVGWQIAGITTVRATLAVLAAFNAISLFAVARVDGGGKPADPSPSKAPAVPIPPSRHTLEGGLAAEKYLLGLATMVALIAAMEALIDWTFAASATKSMTDGRALLRFFSAFHAVVAVLAFLAQSLLSRRSLERVGLAGTLATLPITVVAFGALAALVPRLATAVLLRGSEMVMSNSLWRSGYELLYTPIQESKKRSTKTLVDVGSDRLGTLLGSAAVTAALALSKRPEELVAILAVALGFAGILVARSLHRGYVGALEDSLRKGARQVEAWAATSMQMDVPLDSLRVVTQPPVLRPSEDEVLRAIATLRGGEQKAVEQILASNDPQPPLAPFVIPLLARPELRQAAAHYLTRLAPRVLGQLVDAVLDPGVPSLARRRIARLLRNQPSQRVVEGLIQGLADERFEIRYECGIALVRVTDKDPSLTIPQAPVLEAVRRELAIEREILEEEEDDEENDRPFTAVLRDRASRGLEHVFTILSLMLDRDPLRIAWRALNTEDDKLRGTALEYLENVVPPQIREALWPYLQRDQTPSSRQRRTREEIERDLTSAQGLIAAALSAIGGPRKSHA